MSQPRFLARSPEEAVLYIKRVRSLEGNALEAMRDQEKGKAEGEKQAKVKGDGFSLARSQGGPVTVRRE